MKKTLKKIYILIFPVFYLMLMLYYQYIRYDILTFISQHNYSFDYHMGIYRIRDYDINLEWNVVGG